MKILQVGKYYVPYFGGMEMIEQWLSEELVRRGHSVTVLAYSHIGPPLRDVVEGVEIIRCKRLGSLFSQPLSREYILMLKRIAGSFDILHFHSLNPIAEAASLSLPGNVRWITTFHHDITKNPLVSPVYRPFLKRFLNRSQRIVISSPHLRTARSLQQFLPKIEVIPFGIPADFLTISTDDVTSKIRELQVRWPGGFILFVGRLTHYKSLDVLLRAMMDIGCPLVIIGEGPEKKRLQRLTAQFHIAQRVHFMGKITDLAELAAYFHASTLFVLPSSKEGETFGIVLLHAMASGKALVTSDIQTGVTWINRHNVTGLHAKTDDPQSFAHAINFLLQNAEIRDKFGRNGKECLESNFQLNKMVDAYENLYLSATSSKTLFT